MTLDKQKDNAEKPTAAFKSMASYYRIMDGVWSLSSTARKRRLLEIAKSKTATNCPWEEYGAAQHIIRRANFSGA